MTYRIAMGCVDQVCNQVEDKATIEFLFFGGEPLLCFDLIKQVVQYVIEIQPKQKCRFFASTNGVLLTDDMKEWFRAKKDIFVLGLSLDGKRESHNYNRSQSYDQIDIGFFKETWPEQNVKMTVSEHTLANYASDVIFLHSLGFGINGGEICLGNNDWKKSGVTELYAKQLMRLIDYYSNCKESHYNAMFDVDIALCAAKNKLPRKQCGIGDKLFFFDTDGRRYPCTFITPMTFDECTIGSIMNTDFKNSENFTDLNCLRNCYLYPICKRCPAENYLKNKSFKQWNREKCGFTEILALAVSEIETRRIINNPKIYDDTKLYFTIEAIKKIRELYQSKYADIMDLQ
jgi:radical SAM protein with 4Fe4S-binding SPASM domain